MQPRVSVVMASYNHVEFVREAMASVLSQSFADLELVITDDGSRDGTADVVRGVTDARIRFHAFAENQGACDAMNNAVVRSKGEYIAVLNSDDYFLPGKLAKQVEYLDGHPETRAVFGMPKFVDEAGRPLEEATHPFAQVFTQANRTRIEWLRRFFEAGNCLCHPTIMLRRECYDRVGLYDPLLMNLPDFDMWIRLCRCFDIHVMAEPLTAFRILARERNTSAPSPANLARAAWETPYVLRHFVDMPEPELRQIVGPWPENEAGRSPLVVLALAALRNGHPSYCHFGLALLRECMRRDRGSFSLKEYFRLVGDRDPMQESFPAAPPPTPLCARILARIRAILAWPSTTEKRR